MLSEAIGVGIPIKMNCIDMVAEVLPPDISGITVYDASDLGQICQAVHDLVKNGREIHAAQKRAVGVQPWSEVINEYIRLCGQVVNEGIL